MGQVEIGLRFGAVAPPLHQQLGIAPVAVDPFQADADAITRLVVRGLLSDAEAERARLRLGRKIVGAVVES
jgi:FAD synthase